MKNASKTAKTAPTVPAAAIEAIVGTMEWTAPKIPAKVSLTAPALALHHGFHRAAFETGSAMRTLIGAALRAINAKVHEAFGQEPEAYAAATMMAAGMPKPSAYASVAAMRCYLAAPEVAATLPVEGLMAIGAAAKRSKDPAKTAKAMMATARRNGGTGKACKAAAKGDTGTGSKAPDYGLAKERERLAGTTAAIIMGQVGGDAEVAKAVALMIPDAIAKIAAERAKAEEAKAKEDGTAERIAEARKAKAEGRAV